MRADATVIEYLNKALRSELTSVNQYWLHYRLLENWGYQTLAKIWRKESIGVLVMGPPPGEEQWLPAVCGGASRHPFPFPREWAQAPSEFA